MSYQKTHFSTASGILTTANRFTVVSHILQTVLSASPKAEEVQISALLQIFHTTLDGGLEQKCFIIKLFELKRLNSFSSFFLPQDYIFKKKHEMFWEVLGREGLELGFESDLTCVEISIHKVHVN